MAKFKLKPVSDFQLPVSFTQPNGDIAEVIFTVVHKKANDIQALFDLPADKRPSDIEFIKQVAKGWDLEEEFSDENIKDAVEWFPDMVRQLAMTYVGALAGMRVKN